MTDTKGLSKLAGANPHLAKLVLALMEHDSPEALKKYLKEHPKAKIKNHRVRKDFKKKGPKDEGAAKPEQKDTSVKEDTSAPKSWGDKLKSLFSKAKPSKAISEAVTKAPEATQRFVADKAYRQDTLKKVTSTMKSSPKGTAKKILSSAKSEVHELKHALKAGKKLFKRPPGPFSGADKAALYAAGAYVVHGALALSGGGPVLAAAALAQSFAMHVGIKAVSQLLDKGFIHYEWAHSLQHIMHLAAKGKGKGKSSSDEEALAEGLVRVIADELAKFSDEDMEKVLKGVSKPSAKGKKAAEKIPGGRGQNTDPSDLDEAQLDMGIKEEMEHTTDKAIAREIAIDHLTDDPKYYTKLKKMHSEDKKAALYRVLKANPTLVDSSHV